MYAYNHAANPVSVSVKDIALLMERGYVLVPLEDSLAVSALGGLATFLKEKSKRERLLWSFGVEDLLDPDDGYIRKTGQDGGDHKHSFHRSRLLPSLLENGGIQLTDSDEDFLSLTGALFEACNNIAYAVGHQLNVQYGLPITFTHELSMAEKSPMQHSRSKLRLTQYDELDSGAATRIHRDKGTISVHALATSGELFMCDGERGGNEKIIVPQQDMAIVFFGLKAEVITAGACKAIWHGARSGADVARAMAVFFAHTNFDMQHSRDFLHV